MEQGLDIAMTTMLQSSDTILTDFNSTAQDDAAKKTVLSGTRYQEMGKYSSSIPLLYIKYPIPMLTVYSWSTGRDNPSASESQCGIHELVYRVPKEPDLLQQDKIHLLHHIRTLCVHYPMDTIPETSQQQDIQSQGHAEDDPNGGRDQG